MTTMPLLLQKVIKHNGGHSRYRTSEYMYSEPRFNELLYNEVLGETNDFLQAPVVQTLNSAIHGG